MSKSDKLLVALLKEPKDFKILVELKWYRIPADKRATPRMVKDESIKYIAFYQGKPFKTDAFQIKYYAKVNQIEKLKRKELFPNEIQNIKSENYYYKISINKLNQLKIPIISRKRRIIIFINSTLNKFKKAKEINDLFLGSRIEEKMWQSLLENQIPAEREFHQKVFNQNFFIDFALFCKNIKLALECDGDKYHLAEKDVKYDKSRDNALKSKGWNVLRYTSKEINYEIDRVITQVKDSVNQYGGIKNEKGVVVFPKNKDENQTNLFDK